VKNRVYDRTFWVMALIFWAFWIIITGSLHYQQLLVGALSALFIAWYNNELLFRSDERSLLDMKALWLYFRYAFHLLIAILQANIQVVVLVLDPRMPISPGMIRFPRTFKKDLNKVILGNSITMTPGTLTVLVEEDEFVVHAITRKNAENVVEWELADELSEIEKAQESVPYEKEVAAGR